MTIILQILKQIVDVTIIISPLLPLIVAITRYVGKKTKNQNIITLTDRADIIVNSLEQFPLELDNIGKRNLAIEKLSEYSKEVGIQLSEDQASDYIESAVKYLKLRSEQLG